jgi:hypothetical protein
MISVSIDNKINNDKMIGENRNSKIILPIKMTDVIGNIITINIFLTIKTL